MVIAGTIIGIIIAYVSFMILGGYGVFIMIAILFGMFLSIYLKTKQNHEDLQLIKKHLGIKAEGESIDGQEENHVNLEKLENDDAAMTKLNKKIEEELKKYISKTEDKN
ncbi:hypothetical protein M6D81_30315 [Paenibacillus sp. J5C_2022]|uniref:hypothetical protein n=1 Tax=Paenibacillus sp. J5C2022 TaxID=2977129 RepID=UPI0021CFF2EB|nr:hypothetical protein [Paenibacillus sp. J5C2022]MCU6713004.1 hypothetical protein [Paenibacillus sp. J5C2022]